MKKKLFIIVSLLFISSLASSKEMDCNQFDKLSAKYIECNAKKIKNDANNKVIEGKEKFDNSVLKNKLIKFKNSKNLMEFLEKD